MQYRSMSEPAVLRPPGALTSERLRDVLDVLEEGVAVLGPDGVVDYVNPSGERILRLAPGEVLGCRLIDFRWGIVDLEGNPLPRESLPTLSAMETGEPAGPVVVGMTSNAVPELAWVEVSARPLRSPGQEGPWATVSSFRDVSARVRAEQALRESEARYHTLAESVPVGIFHAGPDGSTLWVNHAMAHIIGQSFEDSLGTGWARTLHPEDREATIEAFRQAAEAGQAYVREHRYLHADGQVRWVVCRATPLTDLHGSVSGWVGSVTDITEDKSAALAKDQLIGHVSHELRAPLVSIRGGLGFLEPHLPEASPDARRFFDMAVRNTELLERLVRDLLDIERLKAGHLELQLQPVAVSEVLTRALEVVGPQAVQLGVTLREPAPTPAVMHADRDRLVQVVTNLLSNAVKFSERGGEVWTDVAGAPGTVTLGVHDRGRGIAPADQERIFEPFAQVRDERADGPGGTGLGLAISRAIVDRHGGRIWVESAPGKGASFYVTLPGS